jgi:hypothetical protein
MRKNYTSECAIPFVLGIFHPDIFSPAALYLVIFIHTCNKNAEIRRTAASKKRYAVCRI